ncbi:MULTISPECIES: hypothetical protein [unclassified Streptomyces]|uniref:hypothetical protein n=1 Tax=unclassified Streptomyces TaxID=2593676 RepID=UPI001BE71561|nr:MULTISPECIES: hypothetical protein [unclassified Streptomyces]MBT2406848.1 hypothetical protein [Streptomyces sp. ISL-21]MBT2455565.1 hypothetical protein [Streptomyces sp. ISL-86]MBT2613537.1 hypothetical protein [Streptomyces sp. ISL-87]
MRNAARAEAGPGPGMRRVLGRIGRCALTYLLIHITAWLVIALVIESEDSFGQLMLIGLGMLPLLGVPSVLLAIVAGLAHTRMDVTRFRLALVLPMLVFVFPTLAASTAEPLFFEIMAQLAFVRLMPTPLIPENWEGQTD